MYRVNAAFAARGRCRSKRRPRHEKPSQRAALLGVQRGSLRENRVGIFVPIGDQTESGTSPTDSQADTTTCPNCAPSPG
ncbi:hypothetical protein ABIB90_008244 [Bradyrhizobium sp. JR4.1]